jgi:hypothetical protein
MAKKLWEIARDAYHGDADAGRMWDQYCQCFSGAQIDRLWQKPIDSEEFSSEMQRDDTVSDKVVKWRADVAPQ